MINILVTAKERSLIECMMRDIINCLYADKAFYNKFIKLNRANNIIQINDDICIRFCTAEENNIRGYRPDYFWTDSKDAENYLTAVGSKKLGYYGKIISVMKKEEKKVVQKPDELFREVTIKEYCTLKNVTKNKVYGLIKRGEIDARKDKDSGKWMIRILKEEFYV